MGRRMSLSALVLLTLIVGSTAQQSQSEARMPPVIKTPAAPATLLYPDKSPVVLQCHAEGIPKPTYTWKYNGGAISSNRITIDARGGNLTISKFEKFDDNKNTLEGFYTCEARVSFGSFFAIATAPKLEVLLASLSPWQPNIPTITVSVNEGEYVQLRCSDKPESTIFTTYAWQGIKAKQQNDLQMDDRMFVDNEGTLHFTYVKYTDSSNSDHPIDHYACGLSGVATKSKVVGGNQKLIVIQQPRIPASEPSIRYYTGLGETGEMRQQKSTFEVGTTGKLECVFSGYIPANEETDYLPTIEWYEGQKKITNGGRYLIKGKGRQLLINKLTEADEKIYTCKAKENNAEASIHLNVTSRPVFQEPTMKHTVVTQGSNATFNCKAISAPTENAPSQPRWTRNGANFRTWYDQGGKYEFLNGRTKLIIKQVSKDTNKEADIACYQCFVTNSVGTSTASGCLNVILGIRIVTRPKEVQTIEEGDIVDFHVRAIGDPLFNLTQEWYFKGQKYAGGNRPPHVLYNTTSNRAYMNTSGFSKDLMRNISGLYQFVVYNNVENVTVNITVQTEKPPVVVQVAAAGFDYWIIVIIVIILIFIVIIIICCIICCRKRLEGDYPVDKKETAAGLDPEKELKDSGFHDLSRADYDYYPEKKGPTMDFDDIPIGEGDDESFGSAEYGEDAMAFTENGSFIGAYSKSKKSAPPAYEPATESKV